MTCQLFALSFDASEPLSLARFWSGVLGWDLADEPHDGVTLLPSDDTGFRLRFLPTRSRKVGQNRMHFDLTSTSLEDQQQTVARALGLGARHIDVGQRPEEDHVVLADPEGNEFCVIEPATTSSPTADSSARWPATVRRRSDTSGARRWDGRWSGIRTRRPRSVHRTAVRRSRRVVHR
ncbi:VOC family protein [Micromonospora sp. NPDC023633]|uniref:VOC family protein n=1 Tax=Micromonospora sp. NPDC023633 TaxID=3154320 RepID=UPI0033FF577C